MPTEVCKVRAKATPGRGRSLRIFRAGRLQETFAWPAARFASEDEGAPSRLEAQQVDLRPHADAQLDAWDKGIGGCYWSYRVDDPAHADWDLRTCVVKGWLDLHHGREDDPIAGNDLLSALGLL